MTTQRRGLRANHFSPFPTRHRFLHSSNLHYDRRRNPEHESAEAFLRAGSRRSRLFHRSECLHRLQSLRGRVQRMEPGAGRRVHLVGKFLRQHRPPRRIDLATRHVPRAGSIKRKSDYGSMGLLRSAIRDRQSAIGGSVPLGFSVRRLQALRRGRLSGGVSNRIDRAHGSRLRSGAERCLQRLRLLRRLVSIRRDRSPAGTAARRRRRFQVHLLLRSTKKRTRPGLRQGLSDRIDRFRPAR